MNSDAKFQKFLQSFKQPSGAKDVVHGAFIREGTMAAFPLCFPGASSPIPLDESHITALALGWDGFVYGGTSGRAAHLFVGMFRGATGAVFDMGVVEGAQTCSAVVCFADRVAACVNDVSQGWIVTAPLQKPPFDLLQEWGFIRVPFRILPPPVPGERILHAVSLCDGRRLLGMTEHHVFQTDVESGEVRILADVPGRGRLVVTGAGILGPDEPPYLWRFDGVELVRRAVRLPDGDWNGAPAYWTHCEHHRRAFTADDSGRIVVVEDGAGKGLPEGQAPLTPVGPLAATPDGRVFGACGRGIANFFRLDARTGEAVNLGAAVSVIERRRYGYEFGDAVVGRDGEIYWGENDNLGHLWLYFPPCPSPARQ